MAGRRCRRQLLRSGFGDNLVNGAGSVFRDLALARGDCRYPRLMRALGGVKLLILDDWGFERSVPSSVTTCWRDPRLDTHPVGQHARPPVAD